MALTALFMFATFANPVQARSSVVLRIGGTGTALGGMQLLATAFLKTDPGFDVIVLPSLGSGGGIKALAAGKIDIAVSARPLKDAESAKGIAASEYARTPIVYGTDHENPATGVTLEQLVPIYSGSKSAWPDGMRLRLVMRPATEGDTELASGFSAEMAKAVATATERRELYVAINDQDAASALEKIPGSLGLTTLAQIMTEGRRIKPLALDGVTGTVEALEAGSYPYAKRLFYVVRSEQSPRVDAFLRFVRSAEGRAILVSTGHAVVDASRN